MLANMIFNMYFSCEACILLKISSNQCRIWALFVLCMVCDSFTDRMEFSIKLTIVGYAQGVTRHIIFSRLSVSGMEKISHLLMVHQLGNFLCRIYTLRYTTVFMW